MTLVREQTLFGSFFSFLFSLLQPDPPPKITQVTSAVAMWYQHMDEKQAKAAMEKQVFLSAGPASPLDRIYAAVSPRRVSTVGPDVGRWGHPPSLFGVRDTACPISTG